ncbi:MAG: hypothetical protein Q8R00_02155 [Candidatus Nanoarchaeia archaeon]|nr:hypothetical protein [Candidatus Nanoarchaeia archaeon]
MKKLTPAEVERLICATTQDEGFGSVHERICLERLLRILQKKYNFKDVLELRARITKGFDNLAIMDKCNITVSDPNIEKIKKDWLYDQKPNFSNKFPDDGKYDLVWNFAMIQQHPEVIKDMIKASKKYVLIAAPNFVSLGTPFHVAWHLITRMPCTHAEQGKVSLRTRGGLETLAKRNGLKIVQSGYVDIPWWPDTAFGFKDIRKFLKIKEKPQEKQEIQNPDKYLAKIKSYMFLETNPFLYPLATPLFAHHTYVLARK